MTSLVGIFLLVLLTLVGCRGLPPVPPPVAVGSATELLARLKNRHPSLKSFQARGRLTYLAPQGNYAGTGLIKGVLPTTLRVDVFHPFGGSVLNFFSDGQQVQVLMAREAKLLEGPATPASLAVFLPPGLTLPQVLNCFTGNLPLNQGPPTTWRFDTEQGQYVVEWQNAAGVIQERLWVDSRSFSPLKDEWYDEQGELRFTLEMNGYDELATGYPRQLTLRTFQQSSELRLHLKEFIPNPPLKSGDLLIPPPAGGAS